jgi:dTDP-4-dehydrorhamnose 3,5-epimerase
MRVSETAIAGVFLVDLEPKGDERGWFARVWCRDELARAGLNADFVQCNGSYSRDAGTLRGLHYQIAPHEEAKLIRCIGGRVYDVVADVRPQSPSYGRWFGVELSAENRRMLYVAPGVAHGYLTLAAHSEVLYPVTASYAPGAERGVRWDDPFFGIVWPEPVGVAAADLTISAKDRAWPDFASVSQNS